MMRCCVPGLLWLMLLVLLSQRVAAAATCVPLPETLQSQCQLCVSPARCCLCTRAREDVFLVCMRARGVLILSVDM